MKKKNEKMRVRGFAGRGRRPFLEQLWGDKRKWFQL